MSAVVQLRWRPPSDFTNGTPITTRITYDVYQFRERSIDAPIEPVLRGLEEPEARITENLTPNTTQCFVVRAYVAGAASRISNIASIHIPGEKA